MNGRNSSYWNSVFLLWLILKQVLHTLIKELVMRSTSICFFIVSCFYAQFPTTGIAWAEEQRQLKEPNVATAQELLETASDILRKSDILRVQDLRIVRLISSVIKAQMCAGDIEGTLRTIQASDYKYRDARYVELACFLARQGKRDRALEVLKQLGTDHGWEQDFLDEGVQINWVEYLIAAGKLEQAEKACDQIKTSHNRPAALLKLAVSYTKSKNPEKAKQYFAQVLQSADSSKVEHDQGYHYGKRAHHYCSCAKAQWEAGFLDDAKQTLEQLEKFSTTFAPGTRIAALREAAVLYEKMQDTPSAKRLFELAISLQSQIEAKYKEEVLRLIALKQVEAGFLDDARKTILTIAAPKNEEVLEAISAMQLKSGDLEKAKQSALEIREYPQYKQGALNKIFDYQISKRDYDNAVKTADEFDNASKKTSAKLKIAAALADAGEKQKATEMANRISLTCIPQAIPLRKEVFNYRLPRTWGINYQDPRVFTSDRFFAIDSAAEVAAAAMKLFQALELKPENTYQDLFYEVTDGPIVQALARAHAATGNVEEAISWAKKIGNDVKIEQTEDYTAFRPMQQRVHALLGVAEGILDRTNLWPQAPFND